jgi:hypothetical protein
MVETGLLPTTIHLQVAGCIVPARPNTDASQPSATTEPRSGAHTLARSSLRLQGIRVAEGNLPLVIPTPVQYTRRLRGSPVAVRPGAGTNQPATTNRTRGRANPSKTSGPCERGTHVWFASYSARRENGRRVRAAEGERVDQLATGVVFTRSDGVS